MKYPPYSYSYAPTYWTNYDPYWAYSNARATTTPNSKPQFLMDPYVVQTLQTVVGKLLVVNTGDGTIRGYLTTVQPDHIVLKEPEGQSTFFVRIQKIVWIMPEPS